MLKDQVLDQDLCVYERSCVSKVVLTCGVLRPKFKKIVHMHTRYIALRCLGCCGNMIILLLYRTWTLRRQAVHTVDKIWAFTWTMPKEA